MSFSEYLNSIDEDYLFIKKYSKPVGELCGIKLEDITHLPYKNIKETIPNLFENSQFEEAIELVLNKKVSLNKIKKQKNSKKLLFLFWIRKQYERINEIEEQYLFSPPDSKLMQAGIKELDVLGNLNTIDNLAGGDILKWNKIESLSYDMIFNKMLKNTIESRINKKLVEINKQ